MKKILLIALTLLIASPAMFAQKAKADTLKHAVYYSCPNHPENVSHEPGKCSICGMTTELSKKEVMKAKEMKNYKCPVHLDVVKHDPGKCPKCGKKLNLSPKEQMKAEVAKIYTCPMHPDVALNKDGVCPKCGKALVEKKNNN